MTIRRAMLRGGGALLCYWSIVNLYFVLAAAPVLAAPTSPLCKDGTYRKAHPQICDTGLAAPGQLPGSTGGGGGGNSGLLGLIGDALGGIL